MWLQTKHPSSKDNDEGSMKIYKSCEIFLHQRIDGINVPLYNPYLSDDTPEDIHTQLHNYKAEFL